MTEDKQRTTTQNKSLHLFFEMIAKQLSDQGYDMKKTLKPEIEIPWTKDSIKEYLFRPVMFAMYQKKSTTELTTKELSKVSETLQRHLSERLGVAIEFPSLESLIIESENQ